QGEGEKYRDRDLRSLKRQNPTEIVGFVSSLISGYAGGYLFVCGIWLAWQWCKTQREKMTHLRADRNH
ncbi:hypothetical protein ACKEW1_20890, partial [Yersinia enterocolitica]